MNIESLISDLAFILLLGAVVTVVFKWIRQPVVLGYIVAGFLASPHFTYLPSVANEANIDFWAQIGIVVLLFTLGLEFSFKKLVTAGGSAVVTALIIVCGMMGVGYCIGYAMGFSTINCLFLGGMLSMSSTTIIIKAFNDLGIRQKKFASLVLAVLIVEDLFAVVMMVILSSIAVNNAVEGEALLMSVAKLVFFLVMWFLVGVFVLPSALGRMRRFLNSETLLVVSMGLCLGMAVFSVYCGFSLALGAFVMGSILAGTNYAERIESVVTPVKDLFGAVFFISVGMMVDPQVIALYWKPILLLSAAVIVGMIIFGSFGMLVTGQSLRVAIESGFSLTQIGEFAFIIATLGMSLGVLEPTLYPIVVAVSVLTTFTTPMFIKMADPVYGFVEKHLPSRLSFLIDRYQKSATDQQAVGAAWAVRLRRQVMRTLIYAILLVAITLLSRQFLLEYLEQIAGEWSHALALLATIAVMSPFLLALLMPLARVFASIRKPNVPTPAIGDIIVAVFNLFLAIVFVVQDISWLFSMTIGVSVALAALLLTTLIFSRRVRRHMSDIETRFMDNLNERELSRKGTNNALVHDLHLAYMTVGFGCPFVGEKLRNSDLRGRYGVNIVSIQRDGVTQAIPGAEARLFPGDIIGVVGNDDQLAAVLAAVEAQQTAPTTASDFQLFNVMLTQDSPLIGKSPRTANMRNGYGALVLAVQRGDEYIDQTPDIAFAPGDILWIAGDRERLRPIIRKQRHTRTAASSQGV